MIPFLTRVEPIQVTIQTDQVGLFYFFPCVCYGCECHMQSRLLEISKSVLKVLRAALHFVSQTKDNPKFSAQIVAILEDRAQGNMKIDLKLFKYDAFFQEMFAL